MTRRHRDLSRREAIALLGAAALTPLVRSARRGFAPDSSGPGFRIRTITVGTNLRSPSDTAPVEAALASLKGAQRVVTDAGYEVQTIRIATQPFLEEAGRRARADAVAALQALDRAMVAAASRPSPFWRKPDAARARTRWPPCRRSTAPWWPSTHS